MAVHIDLTGKTAIVTGGSGGVGRQVALLFAQAGATVYATDIHAAGVTPGSTGSPGAIKSLALDIARPGEIADGFDIIANEAGRIDILVNCAGVYEKQLLPDITEAEFDRIITINLKGVLFATQAAARHMIASGRGGAIVNIASAAGRRASSGSMVYSASKAGVISLTMGAAQELAPYGVRMNAIAPGAVETPMWEHVKIAYAGAGKAGAPTVEQAQLSATPLGRLCSPMDCAQAVLFLAGDQSAFVTGQTLNVDGGLFMN